MRERLPNRRASVTFDFVHNGHRYAATASVFPGTDRLAEVFLSNGKSGSDADTAARDAAIAASVALQFGTPVSAIQGALLRDARGEASSPLGAALDEINNARRTPCGNSKERTVIMNGPPMKAGGMIDPLEAYLLREGAGDPVPLFHGDFIAIDGRSGAWSRNKQPMSVTEPFLIDVPNVVIGFVKMADGKPVDRTHLGYLFQGFQPPERDKLGDLDQRNWPWDNGKRKDPWRPAIYLPLRNSKGEPLVYSPFAPTQLAAIRSFLAAYKREKVEGKYPMALLRSRSFPNDAGGTTFVPVFEFTGQWVLLDGEAAPAPKLIPVAKPQLPKPVEHKQDEPPHDDMNDDIPF